MDENTKFYCMECERMVDEVLIDGYIFGDRLLEGVMFRVIDVDGVPKCIGVTSECEPYFSQLNTVMWLDRCEEFCKNYDFGECPKCSDDVIIWGG